MKSSQRIRLALQKYQHKPDTQQGILGNAVGEISVPNRVDYVYVRVAGLGTISVYNKRVPLILDLPVDVGYDPLEPKNFQVLNIHRYPQGGGRGLVDVSTILHGKTHNWAGIDPVYIEKRQLMPLRPTPMGGMNVYITREVAYYDDKAVVVTGQQLNLAPYVPATGSWLVLLYKDTDEIVKVSTGGALKDIFTLSLDDAPQAYPGTVPIALVRLYGGQTGIAEGYGDTDLIDVRQLFSPLDLTGTSSSGGHVIQDEGVSRTQRTNLNFKGSLVWAIDNAGADSTDIIISGSAGATISNHDHSGDVGDGGRFPLVNLQSTGATTGKLPVADGAGDIDWKAGLDWFNVEDYGAVHNGSTDDTGAIQDAIDAAGAAGGGVVYFPAGIYIITGSLQTANGANGQLLLPSIDCATGEQIVIKLLGEVPPSASPAVLGATFGTPGRGAILKSTITGSVGGRLLDAHGPVGSYEGYSLITVHLENLTFRMPANPVMSAVNLNLVVGVETHNVVIDTGEYLIANVSEPTTATSKGFLSPAINNGAWTKIDGLTVIGFYEGVEVNEHFDGDMIQIWGSKYGLSYQAAPHASYIKRALIVDCPNNIKFSSGTHYTEIEQLDIERYSGSPAKWFDPIYDIDDANNYGYGKIAWHVVLGGTGVVHTIVKNGGSNIALSELGITNTPLIDADTVDGHHASDFLPNPTTSAGDLVYRANADSNVALTSLGASAAAKTTYLTFVPNNAINGLDDYYSSVDPVAGQWITIDLGSEIEIASWRFFGTNPGDVNWATRYTISYSHTGVEPFTYLLTHDPVVQNESFSFPSPVTARYWRFTAINGGSGGWAIWVIELREPVSYARLGIGDAGDVLTVVSGVPSWEASSSGVVTGSHTIMDEGVTLPHQPVLNFIGNSVWAVNNAGQGRTDIIVSGTSSGGGHTIENEGSPLTQRTKLNFVGASVDVTDDAGNDRTIVTVSPITGSSSGGYTEGARVYNNASVSINSGSSTAIAMNSERYDTNTIHDNSTNNSRLTCKTAGKYMIVGNVQWQGNNTGIRALSIRLNTSTLIAACLTGAVQNDNTTQTISTIYDLGINDYVELFAYQNCGSPLNAEVGANYSPEFMMQRIG